MLTLTLFSEADLPTFSRNNVISCEVEVDNIGFASDLRRQLFVHASNRIDRGDRGGCSGVAGVAAGLVHQDCPVTIRDRQVVIDTVETTILNVKLRGIKCQCQGISYLDFYRVHPLNAVWVRRRVVI